jgi:hypothetical protein
VQSVFVNRGVFINTDGAFEDIDGADQNESVAGHGFEVSDQAVDVLEINHGVAIGNPFLGGRGSARYRIESPLFYILDVSRAIQ